MKNSSLSFRLPPLFLPRMNVRNFLRAYFVLVLLFQFSNTIGFFSYELNFTWRGLFLATLSIFAFLELSSRSYKKRAGRHLHWSLWLGAALMVTADTLSDMLSLFGTFWWWDRCMHFFITGIGAGVIYRFWDYFLVSPETIETRGVGRQSLSRFRVFFTATLTFALSALYEIEEYIEDILFDSQRLGPGTDTADDLLFGLLGIACALVAIHLFKPKKQHKVL